VKANLVKIYMMLSLTVLVFAGGTYTALHVGNTASVRIKLLMLRGWSNKFNCTIKCDNSSILYNVA